MKESQIWLIWIISLFSILGVLMRPGKLPEWVWAVAGSILLIASGLVPIHTAGAAALKGTDVYFFLVGMMLLSEQARAEGLFDWVAKWATHHARGSSRRLFVLIYLAGIVVTVFLSNDATAVVLTPAVYAAVKKSGAKPAPYLFACALIANAASFVLPISNPANLVVFNDNMPSILQWLRLFGLPSLVSIAATYLVLRIWFRKSLSAPIESPTQSKEDDASEKLKPEGRWTAIGLVFVVAVLMIASSAGWSLGLPTFVSATATAAMIAIKKRKWPIEILKHIAWGVIPLVAGLFIIVEAISTAGALKWVHQFLTHTGQLPVLAGKLMSAFGVGILANLINNLPVGLISGMAVHHPDVPQSIRNAILIGVDLGPNLSVTGSLATLLWLMALRREKEPVNGWSFFKLGLVAMPVALALSVALLL